MPEPLTITALALAAGSAAMGAYSSISQASAQKDAANYNAKVAENNATQAQQEAGFEADRIRTRNRHVLASQRAALGASGAQLSGTAADVMNDSATQGELDVLAAQYSGEVKSKSYQAEAQLQRATGANASKAGILGATASAVSGAASGVSIYSGYRYRKQVAAKGGP